MTLQRSMIPPPADEHPPVDHVNRSRRTVIAGLALATAVNAVVAVATATKAAAKSGDAELIQLGVQFDAVAAELDTSDDEVSKFQKVLLDELAARGGDMRGDELLLARWRDIGARAAEQRNSALADEIEDIIERIQATPATCCAGLVVKMRVLRWMMKIIDRGDRREQDPSEQWFNEIDDEVRRLASAGAA